MLVNELKRILFNKKMLLLVSLMLVVNVFYIVSKHSDTVQYNLIYDELVDNGEVQDSKINEFMINADENLLISSSFSYFMTKNSEFNNLKNRLEEEIKLLKEYKTTRLYEADYYQTKFDNEIYRNEQILESEIEFSNDFLINIVESSSIFELSILIFSIYFIYELFYEDINSGLSDLLRTSTKGRKSLFFIKIISFVILLLSVLIILFLLRTVMLLLYDNDLNTATFQITALKNSSIISSYIKFSLIKLLYLFLAGVLIGSIILFTVFVFKNITISFSLIAILLAVGFFSNAFISPNSNLFFLKYFNLYYVSLLNRFNVFDLNILGYYIDGNQIILIFMIISISLLFFGSYYFQSKRVSMSSISRNDYYSVKTTSNFMHNVINILFNYRMILLIALVIGYSVFKYADYNVTINPAEKSFNEYQVQFIGPINNDLISRINKEDELITAAEIEVMKVVNSNFSEIDDEEFLKYKMIADNRYNLERVKSDISQAQLVDAEYYINDVAYKNLFMVDAFVLLEFYTLLILLVGVIVSALSSGYERRIAINDLFKTTSIGYKIHDRNKEIITLIIVNINILTIYILQFLKTAKYFRIDNNLSLNVAIAASSSLTVGLSYIILVCQIMVFTSLISIIIFRLAKKIDYVLVILLSTVIITVSIYIYSSIPSLSIITYTSFNIFDNILKVVLADVILILIACRLKYRLK